MSRKLVYTIEKNDELYHYGVKGMKWGVRRTPEELGYGSKTSQKSNKTLTGTDSPEELSNWMKRNIGYDEFTKLKSPEETLHSKKGSCHDQVMLELSELEKMGLNPKAKFLIEYNPTSNQGGTTHSFVYYEKSGKTYWFENAWGGQEGVHEYNNVDEIVRDIRDKHSDGLFGDSSRFRNLEFSDFGDHEPGESLQEVVDKALSTEDIKHSFTDKPPLDELMHYGVKGMKWGVRRTAAQLGRAIKKADSSLKRSISESNKRANERKRERKLREMKGKPKKMSSDELKRRIERLKMEKEYRSLMNETRNRGRKTVGDVISDIGKNTAKNLGTQVGVYTIGKLINKLAGQDVVNPTKGQKDK